MADVVDPATRSRMMSGIRGKDTKPELVVRRGLHRRGLRYRLHAPGVFGKPDLVFPSRRAVIFVNGCFWHGHDCRYFKLPTTRPEFWRHKIERNRERDAEVASRLEAEGWRRLVIWECALRGVGGAEQQRVIDQAAAWLASNAPQGEIRGR